jgi:hypothetical protein
MTFAYDPVALPNPDGALSFLAQPERWPDIGCANGRFTPLPSTGLDGQTFEIEVGGRADAALSRVHARLRDLHGTSLRRWTRG